MESHLHLEIQPQPDNTTCGPTCLHAVYRYYGDEAELGHVVQECSQLKEGGTLAVELGNHALRRGYDATIYTYDLQMFDPTWFHPTPQPLAERLVAQKKAKCKPKLHTATDSYLEFLERGGQIRMEDLSRWLIREYLNAAVPILTGLSATYLYRDAREAGPHWVPDDICGEPAGHFVVLTGYDRLTKRVKIADPLHPNPLAASQKYEVGIDRVISAILLGILTYDANMLIVRPRKA
ncbi:MAG: hypothetical protein WD176_04040 [Pirellulales bacterium]